MREAQFLTSFFRELFSEICILLSRTTHKFSSFNRMVLSEHRMIFSKTLSCTIFTHLLTGFYRMSMSYHTASFTTSCEIAADVKNVVVIVIQTERIFKKNVIYFPLESFFVGNGSDTNFYSNSVSLDDPVPFVASIERICWTVLYAFSDIETSR